MTPEGIALVHKMTRWQRKLWQRAGRPEDIAELRRFTRLQRDGSELWEGEVLKPFPTRAYPETPPVGPATGVAEAMMMAIARMHSR